jgi:hypothetical protein
MAKKGRECGSGVFGPGVERQGSTLGAEERAALVKAMGQRLREAARRIGPVVRASWGEWKGMESEGFAVLWRRANRALREVQGALEQLELIRKRGR